MTRTMITLSILAFFWPYWAQQAPRYYYPRPAAKPAKRPCQKAAAKKGAKK
ncbi:MAG: hypothetical protein IKE64_03025 [Thermoguttaceae bacterium]|nr:hypothetical protein [Thermoguttaceae bacterium]